MGDDQSKLYTIRWMRREDFPRCHELREQVGWNQTLRDWERFLSYDPEGCFVAEVDGIVVGTVCTIPYEDRFGWVAMVIVDPGQRRKGIGTGLLDAGIRHLEDLGLTVKLDATPEGRLLYNTLGFTDEYGAARYHAKGMEVPNPDQLCQPLSRNDLDELDGYDAPIFGASRRKVLESYLVEYPGIAYAVRKNGLMRGYILAREGSHAFHIGPWAADAVPAAQSLLYALIRRRKSERIFIDLVDRNPYVRPMLEVLGFQMQRPFIRMFRGVNRYPGIPEKVYGISGPELG